MRWPASIDTNNSYPAARWLPLFRISSDTVRARAKNYVGVLADAGCGHHPLGRRALGGGVNLRKFNTTLCKISYLCTETNTLNDMAKELKINDKDPWWVIALKVIAYLIGLILAGVGTTASAQMIGLI